MPPEGIPQFESASSHPALAIHLAAAGHRLFGDDRLAVRLADGHGLCLGLMPKVRLPVPGDAGPRFAEFVDAYTELEGDGVAYLKPLATEAARFGDAAPIAALVLLERVDGAEVALAAVSPAEVVRVLVENVHAPHIASRDLVPRLAALAAKISGYRLRFSSSRLAAERLAGLLTGRVPSDA
jgi:hypothetical protein